MGYGHVVATRADGCQLSLNVTLPGKMESTNRTRLEEDVFISHLVLRTIELIQQAESGIKKNDNTATDAGDSISEEWGSAVVDHGEEEDVAIATANRILGGNEQALVLLPMYNKEGRPTSFRALKLPVIPNGSLIFPESFNPPHRGHIALAQAAVNTSNAMTGRHNEKPIFMELSLTNADKPPIDPATVSQRVNAFLELDDLPEQWGIILTKAPLVSQKVASLQECVVNKLDGPVPEISFVIGADTLVRIINPKYYNDDESEMIKALHSMHGVRFFAGGCLEQKKDSPEPAHFIKGTDETAGLPEDIKKMFTIIQEREFRVDISSTDIRKDETERVPSSSWPAYVLVPNVHSTSVRSVVAAIRESWSKSKSFLALATWSPMLASWPP
jgi:nicotinic acid mononucleotide adenylyltransferase